MIVHFQECQILIWPRNQDFALLKKAIFSNSIGIMLRKIPDRVSNPIRRAI